MVNNGALEALHGCAFMYWGATAGLSSMHAMATTQAEPPQPGGQGVEKQQSMTTPWQHLLSGHDGHATHRHKTPLRCED